MFLLKLYCSFAGSCNIIRVLFCSSHCYFDHKKGKKTKNYCQTIRKTPKSILFDDIKFSNFLGFWIIKVSYCIKEEAFLMMAGNILAKIYIMELELYVK